MLSLITNTSGVTPCDNGATIFRGTCPTKLTKLANTSKNVLAENTGGNKRVLPILFASVAMAIAKIFSRELEFDDKTGKLLSISKYKQGKLTKVRHFGDGLRKLKSIDEYKDGIIYKTTTYDKSTGKRQWLIEYSPKGDDRITEFYSDGIKIKSVQYEQKDILKDTFYFDESGKTTKIVQYNKDETIASAILYEDDKTILETYDHGILKSDNITYNKSCNRVERTYDETGKISSAREEGKGYETYFAYENGKKIWSGTYYTGDNPVAYKRVEYDEAGAPKVAYLYEDDRTLYGKTEFIDGTTRIHTKYTKDGQVKSVETVDTRTGKTTRQYRKVKAAAV